MVYNISETKLKFSFNGPIALDTNVLLWFFYDNIVYTTGYQKKYYPPFIDGLIERGHELYTSIYNIFEFFNIVEDNEYKIYLSNHEIDEKNCSKKSYRKLADERKKLKAKMNLLYEQIRSIVKILEYSINNEDVSSFVENYDKHRYDTFDYCLINVCLENGIKYVLTDDSDFYSGAYKLESINIVTANRNLK